MHIRPFEPTDAEYEAVVALVNSIYTDMQPSTASDWRHRDETRNAKYFYQRLVAVNEAGLLAAVGVVLEPRSQEVAGKYVIDMDVPAANAGAVAPLFECLVEQVAEREPKLNALLVYTREDQTHITDFLQGRGFEQKMRFPTSEIDLSTFNAAPHAGLTDKLAARGIHIYSFEQMSQRDPQWQDKLYELDWEIEQDIPQPNPPVREPMEEFLKWFERPSHRGDSCFVAVDETTDEPGGTYAGISTISVRVPKPERVSVGVTGVARAYRRRGVATALKLKSFAFAESIGARYVSTDNEENNPMYTLNLQLGFKPKPAWLDFEKALDKAESEPNAAELAMGN